MTVRVGEHDRLRDENEFSVESEQVITHEDHRGPNGFSNDVCLIKVPSLMEAKGCSGCFSRACLPARNYTHGEACHASGWGYAEDDARPARLREVGVRLLSHEYCLEHSDYRPDQLESDTEVCIGRVNHQGGPIIMTSSTCRGDSGTLVSFALISKWVV